MTVTAEPIVYRAGMGSASGAVDADPITTEVIRHGLNSAAEQLKRALVRTAFSPLNYEVLDFAVAIYDRDVKAGRWSYLSPGSIRRASDLTVGILGLGRIGKRFAHLARNCFGRVIACDPYIIDGDFPAYVQRVGLDALFE